MSYLVFGSVNSLIVSSFCEYLRGLDKTVCRFEFNLKDPLNFILFFKEVNKSDYILFCVDKVNDEINTVLNFFPAKYFVILSSCFCEYKSIIGEKYINICNVYGDKLCNISSCIRMALNTGVIDMSHKSFSFEQDQYVYIDDCCEFLFNVFNNFVKCETNMTLSTGKFISVNELIDNICGIIPNTKVIEYNKNSDRLVKKSYLSNDLYKCKISIDKGLNLVVNKIRHDNNLSFTLLKSLIDRTLHGVGDSDQHLMTMFSIVLQLKAKRILELGVRMGVTTLPFLLGAEKTGGFVVSVDINNTEFKCPDHLSHLWNFKQQDAVSFLESCVVDEPWDLIFIDDWHSYDHVKAELKLIDLQIGSSTVVLLHDLMYANFEPHYHTDMDVRDGQWANGGPYRAVAELDKNFWEFSTIPVCNGLTILRKKYSRLKFK